MYDVVIVGAGIVGCCIARELARYDLNICVIDKCEDVCDGTSKANSAIIHAGYDAKYGTLKARLNVLGNSMMDELARELDFPFERNGSLVVMYEGDDRLKLEELLERGQRNGVPGLRIVEREELHRLEPMLADDAEAALYAPSAGIVCPFLMTAAMAENACANGVEFIFDTCVNDIKKTEKGYELQAQKHEAFKEAEHVVIETKAVVNAAGVYSDTIHNLVSSEKYSVVPRRGCYYILDKSVGSTVSHTVFSLPGAMGKGILTAPTIHGNVIVGPDALDIDDKEGTNTDAEELALVKKSFMRNFKNAPIKQVITTFAGLRAHADRKDFIIGECADAPMFFDCVGVESPGLSASPAIGVMVARNVAEKLSASLKDNFLSERKGILSPMKLPTEERNELIKEHPEYGNIICRCEMISEGEIMDAIRRKPGARSLDGVKRRVRAGMGRCQAGFCSPKAMEILSRELDIPYKQITKSGAGSYMIPNEDLNGKYRQK